MRKLVRSLGVAFAGSALTLVGVPAHAAVERSSYSYCDPDPDYVLSACFAFSSQYSLVNRDGIFRSNSISTGSVQLVFLDGSHWSSTFSEHHTTVYSKNNEVFRDVERRVLTYEGVTCTVKIQWLFAAGQDRAYADFRSLSCEDIPPFPEQ